MDRDANYVAVGAFVILVIAMAVAFVLWYTEHRDKREYARYEIYFQGSVSGLNEGGPVRFLGVNVGRVVRVELDPQERNRVMVIVDIDVTAPIDGRSLASLNLQGVTGLLFIDLEQDHASNAPTTLEQGLNYPVIRSRSSDFDKLLSALPTLAGHAADVMDKLSETLSESNIQAFSDAVQNLRKASDDLPKTLEKTDAMLAEVRAAARDVDETATSLRAVTEDAGPEVHRILERTDELTENLVSASKRLDQFIANNQTGISRFTNEGLPEFDRLVRETRAAVKDVRELSRSLKQNPSQILFEPKYSGVEVPR